MGKQDNLFLFLCILQNHSSYIKVIEREHALNQTSGRHYKSLIKRIQNYLKRNMNNMKKIKYLKKHLLTKMNSRNRCQNKNIHLEKSKRAPLKYYRCEDCQMNFSFPICYNDYHSNNDDIYFFDNESTSEFSN
ncbi:hypothetical protein DMUE_6186 [Dictyocoela muelleri]|nr:hypothetical protein DMUE_6186 [Dictyocoela muelleri]